MLIQYQGINLSGHGVLMTEEAGDDDLGYVRSVGTPAADTHHSEGEI